MSASPPSPEISISPQLEELSTDIHDRMLAASSEEAIKIYLQVLQREADPKALGTYFGAVISGLIDTIRMVITPLPNKDQAILLRHASNKIRGFADQLSLEN